MEINFGPVTTGEKDGPEVPPTMVNSMTLLSTSIEREESPADLHLSIILLTPGSTMKMLLTPRDISSNTKLSSSLSTREPIKTEVMVLSTPALRPSSLGTSEVTESLWFPLFDI